MKKRNHFKIISIILSIAIILSMSFFASADQAISVYMNDEKISFDVEPMLINDRTMVPMRAIFEKLGAEVSWDATTKTAIALKDAEYVSITIGASSMNTHSGEVLLDSPALIIEDRTLIPLRAVSEAFKCEVKWDGTSSTVNIYSNDYVRESTPQDIINVATPSELLAAIGSDKKIILTSNYYDLSNLSPINNEYVEKQQDYFDEFLDSYIIKNVTNMTIEGNAEITINDKMADVLKFENCEKITLSGLTIGHSSSYDEYQCEGAVIRFESCDTININECNLYGCGAFGIYADDVQNLNVSGGKIYDCTYTGIWLTNYSDAIVKNTEFCDSVLASGFLRIDDSTIHCIDCNIHDIECMAWVEGFIETLDSVDSPSAIAFTNCNFSDNKFNKIASIYDVSKIAFDNCTFNNNIGDMLDFVNDTK